MGKTFCVEFVLKFHTKYIAHGLKDKIFTKLELRTHMHVWIPQTTDG